jgi:hypothetical protein
MENPKKGSLFEGKLFYVLGPKADEWTQKIKAAGGKVLQVVKKNKNQIAILPIETEFQLAQDLRRRLETAQVMETKKPLFVALLDLLIELLS